MEDRFGSFVRRVGSLARRPAHISCSATWSVEHDVFGMPTQTARAQVAADHSAREPPLSRAWALEALIDHAERWFQQYLALGHSVSLSRRQ